jgi:hypothetical protein
MCIQAALERTPTVSEITHKKMQGGRPITSTGIKPAGVVDYYFYKSGPIQGNIHVETDYSGKSVVSQTYGALNRKPPQEHIVYIRPLMKAIEVNVERECGINGFSGSVVESCGGIDCQPL